MVLESLVPVLGIPRAEPVQGGLSSLGVLNWDLSVNSLVGVSWSGWVSIT